MASSLNEASIQKKLESLNATQESIETLAIWCLHHKESYQLIVNTWINSLRTCQANQKSTLLYLCNDVCQRERQKKVDLYRNAFTTVLKEAMSILKAEETKSSTERILGIWSERDIFSSALLDEFKNILNNSKSINGFSSTALHNKEAILNDFKLENLLTDLEKHMKDTETMTKARSCLPNVPYHNDGDVKSILKDRQEGVSYAKEIDSAHTKLTDFVLDFERYLANKQKVITLLEQAQIFYETQLSEAKIVETAYRKFGSGVDIVQQEVKKIIKAGSSSALSLVSPNDGDPFAQGVESVAAASKPNTSLVDMDIEEDGMKVTTNRSFLSSTSIADVERLLFNSPPVPMVSQSDMKLAPGNQQQQQQQAWAKQGIIVGAMQQNAQSASGLPPPPAAPPLDPSYISMYSRFPPPPPPMQGGMGARPTVAPPSDPFGGGGAQLMYQQPPPSQQQQTNMFMNDGRGARPQATFLYSPDQPPPPIMFTDTNRPPPPPPYGGYASGGTGQQGLNTPPRFSMAPPTTQPYTPTAPQMYSPSLGSTPTVPPANRQANPSTNSNNNQDWSPTGRPGGGVNRTNLTVLNTSGGGQMAVQTGHTQGPPMDSDMRFMQHQNRPMQNIPAMMPTGNLGPHATFNAGYFDNSNEFEYEYQY